MPIGKFLLSELCDYLKPVSKKLKELLSEISMISD
jgi:hypothetical protein